MNKIKSIAANLIIIAAVVLFPHMGLIPIPFGYVIPVLSVIWLFLKYNKEDFADIGFRFRWVSPHAVWIGTLTAVLVFSFLTWIFFPLLEKFVVLASDLSDFNFVRGNKANYIFLLLMGWVVGGLYEEIVFHGFIFTRIEQIIPGRSAVLVSFIFTNIIFALYHLQLGSGGVINALLAGSAYHALSLYFKRNLWYGIICHGVFDTIGITFIYAGYW